MCHQCNNYACKLSCSIYRRRLCGLFLCFYVYNTSAKPVWNLIFLIWPKVWRKILKSLGVFEGKDNFLENFPSPSINASRLSDVNLVQNLATVLKSPYRARRFSPFESVIFLKLISISLSFTICRVLWRYGQSGH